MQYTNPIIWADFPDPDVIRIGNMYYMITTTMFFTPAAPVMRSQDLINWEIVSYVTDTIEGYDMVGVGYGRGQWATSLRRRGNTVYAFYTCLDLGKSFLFSTNDIEKSNWDCVVLNAPYHDASIVFDQQNAYLIYNAGDVRMLKFQSDMSGIEEESDVPLFSTPAEGMALRCEGCRGFYKDGWYYLLFIDIPKNGIRREWCYRARSITGPYESRLIADSTCGHKNRGVAQGMLVDTPQGDWFMVLFGDCGAVGRIPFLFPVTWEEDWPVIGGAAGMQLSYGVPLLPEVKAPMIYSDTFAHSENKLALFWQWNHNPDNNRWSFTEKPGTLSLHAAPADDLLQARNTLTQRTCGPQSVFTVCVDVSQLNPGDQAGLSALQWDYVAADICVNTAGERVLTAKKRTVPFMQKEGTVAPFFIASITCDKVWLKAVFNYAQAADTVQFAYSENGEAWQSIGEPQKISFNMHYFVGTRIAISCYGSGAGCARFSDFTAEIPKEV